ncbi:ABC transporter permease [Plastorhodobacter daqingensis]|uniref:Transport permease protein n=1 Tax=Plastorhodobacter daqingensis TaxID=1387281 RepID=A0ABW2UN94_9RHOB
MQALKPRNRTGGALRMPRTVAALMLREMATSYGRSPGGYLWAIAEPAAALALLSVIFSTAFAAPSVGVNFPLFYATGYLPFMLFNDVGNKMATSIRFSKQLLAYPVVTFLDALVARFLLNLLTQATVMIIVFTAILMIFDTRAVLHMPSILASVAMAAGLGLGVGTLNCYLMTAFPAWERSWQIATRPLFLISGIFFIYDDIPSPVREILWYNPLMHVVGMMRRGFYGFYHANYVSPLYVTCIALATLALGLLLLRRHQRALLQD